MVRLALAVMLAALPVSAAAPAVPSSDAHFAGRVAAGIKQVQAAVSPWKSVSLSVRAESSHASVSEPWTRVSLTGSKSSASWSFTGWAGNEFLSFSALPSGEGWTLWGSGVSVSLRPSGDGYWAAGSVGRQSFGATLDRWSGGWTVWGLQGASLTVSGSAGRYTASGRIDEDLFDRRSLAVLGAALAVASAEPAKE